ncbi:MAG TPA: hypothetical protein VFG10_01930 [Saprospiraceae bacterium]|nr:hypothetical protein [Saprospiraceae bacterium]
MKSAKNFTLIIASMCFMVILGAAVYEHVVLIPEWSAALPASLSMYQGPYGLHPEKFWIPIHPFTILCLGIALVVNWKSNRRKNIFIVIGGYIFILVLTFGYFVPELIRLTETPFSDNIDADLVKRASTWEALSLVRLVGIAILSFILLSALPKSHEKHKKHTSQPTSQAAPLAYDNDSKGG